MGERRLPGRQGRRALGYLGIRSWPANVSASGRYQRTPPCPSSAHGIYSQAAHSEAGGRDQPNGRYS